MEGRALRRDWGCGQGVGSAEDSTWTTHRAEGKVMILSVKFCERRFNCQMRRLSVMAERVEATRA